MLRSNIEFAKRIFTDRLGDKYVYGGTWNPFDTHQGCDCSGEVTDELGAAFFGTDMHWDREGLSTESYRYKPLGPQRIGPFDLVHVGRPQDVPANAAVKIGIHHEGEGGPDSHMWCEVDGVRMETNGSLGTCVGRAYDDAYGNDWWYVPGPIQEDGTPITTIEPPDTLFADVSEFQVPVNDQYPYAVLSIRSNDGTHQDAHFAQNYQWCKNAADSGRLKFFIVYFYWRPGSGDVDTHMAMVNANGGPHPKMVVMMDVESGGNPRGDQSPELNAEHDRLVAWLGDFRRVIAYANLGDARSMWVNHPDEGWILAGYGANPNDPLYRKIAHQYTDGQGYGGGLPEGCPPFGNCDMNSADGLTPSAFAAACGINTDTTPPGGISMADAAAIINDVAGLDVNGVPDPWRLVKVRHELAAGEIIADPARQEWDSQHNGVAYPGTYDAFEQLVGVAEQIAWVHTFSDGVKRDVSTILIELGEFLVAQSKK